MLLFSEGDRSDSRPAAYGEDSFRFLDRVSGIFWDRIRSELEGWYQAFPDDDRDLRQRFRSPIPAQHYAAWWELYLHRLFSRLGFEIDVHPPLTGTTARPDFRLTRGNEAFYLEALTVFSGIVEEGRHGALEAQVMDAINSIDNHSFNLMLDFDRVGKSSPKRRKIVEPISAWLSGLDPDALLAELDNGAELPHKELTADDWVLDLRAMPLKPEHRNSDDHRLIGVGPVMAGSVNDREQLGRALRRKRSKYGHTDLPLVVAALSLRLRRSRDVRPVLLAATSSVSRSAAVAAQTAPRTDYGQNETRSQGHAFRHSLPGST